jgi:hypothetical protein
MLESLLKKTPRRDNVVPLLQARLQAETQDAAAADRRYTEAALAAADGASDPKAADKAHATALEAAQRKDRTERTLQAAQDRVAQQTKDDARAALAQQFDNAQKAVERLAKAATHTESTLAAAVKAIHAQRQATADLHAALPGNFPHSMRDGLWTEADDLQVSVKGEFERLRLWHSSEPLHEWQPFALKYNHAVELLRQRAAAFLAKQP